MKISQRFLYLATFLMVYPAILFAGEWSGFAGIESQVFFDSPQHENQEGNNNSIVIRPEFYQTWNDEAQSLLFTPYFRVDQHDSERTHFDINELIWLRTSPSFDLRIGIGKVFWGVTESQHLVDIINQTDLVDDFRADQKLGQPMVNLTMERDWGILDLFVLPFFRERTFAGEAGRLRTPLIIDTEHPVYESSEDENHIDFAGRWSQYFDELEMGVSFFNGTSRDPDFIVVKQNNNSPILQPFYQQITQFGLDSQLTLESWIWKLEVIRRETKNDKYFASTTGGEYTFYQVFNTDADLGWVFEHLYDDRGKKSSTPFQNDFMTGVRWVLNDVQSTEALLGAFFDLDKNSASLSVESSRRFGDQWKAKLNLQIMDNVNDKDSLAVFKKDSHLELKLNYFF